MVKPSLFIGSSSEGIEIAEAIQLNLSAYAEVTIWNQNVFELSQATLESLIKLLDRFDFAVIVLTPDDVLFSRERTFESARDNVFIELGLFMGKLGRERTFLIFDQDSKIKIPSDLSGITLAGFHGKRIDENMSAALGPACTQIKQHMRKINVRKVITNLGELPESLSFDFMIKEFNEAVDELEQNNQKLLDKIVSRGDHKRMIDGLFSAVLFISRSLVTGYVDPIIYGNMMEYEEKSTSLRPKYFAGPYNHEIICRYFPIDDLRGGIAGEAFSKNEVVIANSMENQFKVKGEGRLKSMISIPIEKREKSSGKTVVVLNIDSAVENAFPSKTSKEYPIIGERIDKITKLTQRINKIAEISISN